MKKFFIFVGVVTVGVYYIYLNVTPDDVLKYVNDNPSSMTPRVSYYVGMVHYSRDECPQAMKAFAVLVSTYPASDWAGESQFRTAQCLEVAHEWTLAKEAYEAYFEKYPNDSHKDVAQKSYELIKFK